MEENRGKGDGRQRRGGDVGRILEWKSDVPHPAIPNINFASLMLEVFSQYRDNTALVDAKTDESYTYEDLRRMVLSTRKGFLAAGLHKGDAVILMSSNHIDIPVVLLSVMLSGAVCVPINPSLTTEELVHVVRVSKAKWAVANTNVIDKVEEVVSLLGPDSMKQVWIIGDSSGSTRPSLGKLMSSFSEHSELKVPFDAATTVALMPFSSGTTGLPKGVMLSHKNLLTTFARIKYLRSLSQNTSFNIYESTLILLPMYHIYGYNMMSYTLFSGGKVVVLARFSPKDYFETIQRYKVTFSPIVPHIMKFLAETPLMEGYDLSSLRSFSTGSSPISEKLLNSLEKKSGKVARQGFGMTESCGIGSNNGGPTGSKPYSIGQLSPYFQGKIVDVETGHLLKENEEGELCLRGPSIMLGYANNPKATAETIDPEGWLHTGDLCYYDQDNFLFLTDRIKDLIKVKGYQVSPAELENIIKRVEGVSEVVVAGVPNDRLGEAPRAWVVPYKGATIDTEAIMKHVADHVTPYKQLAGGIEVVKNLPKNHLGKILRRQLRKSYIASRSKL